MTKKKWTAAEVITAVRKHYGAEKDGFGPEWASLTEFSLHPGGGGRRADLFLVRAWSGKPKGHERITIEVKVSRADFLREKAQPHKMDPFKRVSHRVYFATPEGVIKDTDDLGDIGHMLVTDKGVTIVRRGVRNNAPESISEKTFVEAFRRGSRAEARERSAQDDPVTQVLHLRQEVARLQRSLTFMSDKEQRLRMAIDTWGQVLTRAGGVPCVCGATLRKASKAEMRSGYYRLLQHDDDSACPQGYPQADFFALIENLTEEKP